MKKLLLFSLTVLLFFSCTTSKLMQKGKHQQQRKHFPEYFRPLYFGMPLLDFEKLKKVEVQGGGLMDFRIEFTETELADFRKEGIREVTYYFDGDSDNPLYEIIIEYVDEAARNKVADKYLGDPNYNDETWKWDTGEGFDLYAWKFASKLVFAGKMPMTEWEDYDF